MFWHPYYTFTNNPVAPPPVVTTATPGGVRKRAIKVRLADVENRESTAEFLKSQLRLRQGIVDVPVPEKPKETRAQRLARQKVEREALRNMEIERREQERIALEAQNNQLLTLILLGSQ